MISFSLKLHICSTINVEYPDKNLSPENERPDGGEMDFLRDGFGIFRSRARYSPIGKTLRRVNIVSLRMMKLADGWMRAKGILEPKAFEVRPVEDGWMVVSRGSSLPIKVFALKQDAVKTARRMAEERQVRVDIFTRTGRLQVSRQYV